MRIPWIRLWQERPELVTHTSAGRWPGPRVSSRTMSWIIGAQEQKKKNGYNFGRLVGSDLTTVKQGNSESSPESLDKS